MTGQTTVAPQRQKPTWSRYSFPESLWSFGTVLAVLLFLGYSLHFLNIDVLMMLGALGKLGGVVADRFYPPDLAYVTDPGYLASILDTLEMSFLGGILGIPRDPAGVVFSLERLAPPQDILSDRSPRRDLLPCHSRNHLDDPVRVRPGLWHAGRCQRADDVLHRVCRQAFRRRDRGR